MSTNQVNKEFIRLMVAPIQRVIEYNALGVNLLNILAIENLEIEEEIVNQYLLFMENYKIVKMREKAPHYSIMYMEP